VHAVGLAASAACGAGVSLAVAAAVGMTGRTTTVREVVDRGPLRGSTSLASSSQTLSAHAIYQVAAPGVVEVGVPRKHAASLGSGFVIDKAGHIVTTEHVVQGARTVSVSFSNDEQRMARIVGTDPSSDVAVLRVHAPASALKPLVLGSSSGIEVGDPVYAIGNPLGEDRSITSGIVSALQRVITSPNGFSIDHVIQTDAALNHGNSGGPLINARGEVVGVNSQIQTTGSSGGNIGIGFAIPIDLVRSVAAQLISNGHVEHADLGVRATAVTPDVAALFHLPVNHGLLVADVVCGTAAAKAGLEGATSQVTVAGVTWPLGGDLIVEADGVPLESTAQLVSIVGDKKPGDLLHLKVYRNTTKETIKKLTLNLKLGRQTPSPRC
jgi:S1-C subfamily serine protease